MASRQPTRESDERTLEGLKLRRQGVSWREVSKRINVAGFANQVRRIADDDIAVEPQAAQFWGRQ